MKKFYTVYLLKCTDNSTYTGCTSNLEQRLTAHQKGEVNHTKTTLPIELITSITFSDKKRFFNSKSTLNQAQVKPFLINDFYNFLLS